MKEKRKAFLLSFLSLLVCISMFIGTTFAWFTDSVTSGVNTIVAGNLDIELEYKNKNVQDWTSVEGKTNLVDPDALWEPGYAEVVYLRIRNMGSLALKYQFAMKIVNETKATNVEGDTFKLSTYLKYGIVENQSEEFANRSEAITAVGAVAQSLSNYSKPGTMVGKDADGYADQYMALVVYMPESVGNEANFRGSIIPKIDLGIKLVATQLNSEEDSFDNTYDEFAPYPVVPDPINTTVSGNITNSAGGVLGNISSSAANRSAAQITVPANAVGEDTNAVFSMELTESKPDSVTYEISLKEQVTGNSIALSSPATVQTTISSGLINVVVKHNGSPMTQVSSKFGMVDGTYYYDKSSGELRICTSSFSPFEISYEFDGVASLNNVPYSSLSSAINAAKDGETVVLLKDAETNASISGKTVTLDLNGNTLSRVDFYFINQTIKISDNANVTIKNGIISSDASYGIYVEGQNSSLTLQNVTLDCEQSGIYNKGGNSNLTLQKTIIDCGYIGVWSDCGKNNVNIKESEISSHYIGVYQNGSYGGNTFEIHNTKITDTYGVGVYISNSAEKDKQKLTIDGCTISGPSAVEIKHTNATITNSTLIGTATPTGSGANGNGSCTDGYAFAVTTNSENDKVTGTVSVSGCKFYNGTTTEGEPNGYVFVYTVADGSSVTIDGSEVTEYNTYGGESGEGSSEE